MDSRRLPFLSAVAVILLPVTTAKSDAGWITGRDGRFLPFRERHSCEVPCQPSCVVANPCECLPLLLPAPCAPPSIAVVPDTVPASPVRISGGAWDMSPTGHATSFLDTNPRGGRGSFVPPPSFSTPFPPLYVLPPGGGSGPPGDTPPGGGSPPPPFGEPPDGPPGGPPGEPPPEPPGVEVKPVPAPPAVVLLVLGAVGFAVFRRRFFPLKV